VAKALSSSPGQRGQGRALLALHGAGDAAGQVRELVGVAQPPRLDFELRVLAEPEPRRADLLYHVPQVIRPPAHFVPPGRELGLLAFEARHRRPARGHFAALDRGVGEAVEHVPLAVGLEQRVGVVLAVEIHQAAAQLGQGADRGGTAVHPRPGTALRRHVAADDQTPLLGLEAQAVQHRAQRVGHRLEHRLHRGAGRARTHLSRVGPRTQQQPQRVHQHGLPGAGFPGQHVEARPRWQRDVGDGSEVTHPELNDHSSSSRSARSPHWRVRRIRLK
jgi:hypothetical protein